MNIATIPAGRLTGKVALITGAAGNLGSEIVRHYLRQGAVVVLSGRTRARLEVAREAALADTGVPPSQADTVVMDGADPASVRAGMADLVARHGRLDILVNNAGSAGPRQPLEKVPLTDDELAQLRAAGSADTETLAQATRNILGVSWNMLRAAAPALAEGASVINVSTIFSRTNYYGRTAYVVPKAALNSLSRLMSEELGARGIRVNTVLPGPIKSERIRSVFATMDQLKGAEPGTTANDYFDLMTLQRAIGDQALQKDYPVRATSPTSASFWAATNRPPSTATTSKSRTACACRPRAAAPSSTGRRCAPWTRSATPCCWPPVNNSTTRWASPGCRPTWARP